MKVQLEDFKRKIEEVGSRLVNCSINCPGIRNDPSKGVIPRCLFLEERDSTLPGVIVVGINPGQHKDKDEETEYYMNRGISYESVKSFYSERGYTHSYYKRIKEILSALEYPGTILWTELVKCENEIKNVMPPLQTFRTCANKYLVEEISIFPENWIIVGIGKEAFKALAYLYPKRKILGFTHPTGSFYFHSLFDKSNGDKNLRPDILKAMEEFKSKPNSTMWLGKNKIEN